VDEPDLRSQGQGGEDDERHNGVPHDRAEQAGWNTPSESDAGEPHEPEEIAVRMTAPAPVALASLPISRPDVVLDGRHHAAMSRAYGLPRCRA
jgi:hypothetical protein